DERAVELDGVLDDHEAVFGVLEGDDEEATDDTEDEDVALHDGLRKKYIAAYPGLRSNFVTACSRNASLNPQTCNPRKNRTGNAATPHARRRATPSLFLPARKLASEASIEAGGNSSAGLRPPEICIPDK